MKIATIEQIASMRPHPNADRLEIASVSGYEVVVPIGLHHPMDKIVFISPDTVLPDGKEWAAFYKSKSSRVKAARIRQVWSEGIVESLSNIGYTGPVVIGREISEDIGVTHYDPPMPQDLAAKGLLPFGIPKTDEERFNSIEVLPFGELVDVVLKIDGQSWSAYQTIEKINRLEGFVGSGVCGRTMEYKLDAENNFTRNERQYEVLQKLATVDRDICIRGEQYGKGIQSSKNNPHSQLPLGLAFFSVWLIDQRRYACKGDPFYAYDFIPTLGLPTCPVLEKDVVLTPELIQKYADGTWPHTTPYEGVVIQHRSGSFKVINRDYDSKK